MIVTLSGAFRNAGDHLIRHRAHELLRRFVDPHVRDFNRLQSLSDGDYATINGARALVLCGGPAYQPGIFPDIYPLDLEKIGVPIIPFGLGYKARLDQGLADFAFTPASVEFIRRIHADIPYSSVRDPATQELLGRYGVENVLMTGCPAWYDLERMREEFPFRSEIETLVFSAPARIDHGAYLLLAYLRSRFPRAKRVLTFQHGFLPGRSFTGAYASASWFAFASAGRLLGYTPVSLAADLSQMMKTYTCRRPGSLLHVGYRVHSHLLCLSRGNPSFLINEDRRGEGQALALGLPSISGNSHSLREDLETVLDTHFDSRGDSMHRARQNIRSTFDVMRRFLESIPPATRG